MPPEPVIYSEKAMDALFLYGPALPLQITMDSPRRIVRLLGLLWYLFWCIPVFIVVAPFIICLFPAWIIEETWKGTHVTSNV